MYLHCNHIINCASMQAKVIQIGNSKGLRLSKTILDQYNIGDSVEIILEKDCIIIKPLADPRAGWADAFKKMHAEGDDQLFIDDVFADENLEEWK